MKSVVRWAIKNSPAMNTLMVGTLIVGALCLASLRREMFPEFELEILLVTLPYPGASPEEVEQGICQKIEEAVRSIDGIKKQTAIAQEGFGYLVLELETWVDVQKTLNEVRSEVDRIPSFPELSEDPEIKQITFREPAIRVGVVGPDAEGLDAELRLREVAESIREDILQLPSVSQANIVGGRPYQIDVEFPEARLREYGLSLGEVAATIRRENLELPGGSMKMNSQEVLLRGKDKRLRGAEIAKLPLLTQQGGVVLTVGDLGHVRDGFEDVAAISRIDGHPGLVVSVDRTKSEDLLQVVEEVHAYVDQWGAKLPSGYSLKTWGDRSVDVRDRMHLLLKNGVQGLILVFLMLALFLDLRLSFWVALGIPIAVLGAGGVLLAAGQTLNMLSMFAFLMALGIVVDDAIVIGENIYAHRERGKDLIEAAVDGTVEVIPSVIASVSTTIIAFMPLFFVSGVMGKFIAVMPVAVIAMLVISLIESTFILPCHLAHAGGDHYVFRTMRSYLRLPFAVRLLMEVLLIATAAALLAVLLTPHAAALPGFLKAVIMAVAVCLIAVALLYPLNQIVQLFHVLSQASERFLGWFIQRWYEPALGWSIRNPGLVIASALSFFLMSLGLVVSGVTPWTVFPATDAYEIEARLTFPDGTPAAVTDAAAQRVEEAIHRVSDKYGQDGQPLIRTTFRAVGQVRDMGAIGPEGRATGSHVAKIEVELVEAGQRNMTSDEIAALWRQEVDEIHGAESVTFGTPEMGPGGADIEFKIVGAVEDMERIEAVAQRCQHKLAEYQGVFDIRDDSRPGKWEFQLRVKDKAKALGVSLAQLAQTVRASYYGEEVMRLQRGRHEVKLMVRYPPRERRSLHNFEEIRVRTADGSEYPLTELADVTVLRGYSEINRVNQLRSITVTADVRESEGNADNTVEDLKQNIVPQLLAEYPGVQILWEGQAEQTNESVTSLVIGLVVALIAMFVLLTVEFRSYLQPLMILCIIPFGVVGAIWGHAIMGLDLTMFTMFGLVALTGVVVNDSIVLIDFINHRVAEGMTIDKALIEAGRRRFRPVLLTSVTTIAGLTPMLMETSFQAQFLIPLAATLVFGLLVATFLVLLLIPTYYRVYFRLTHPSAAAQAPDVVPAPELASEPRPYRESLAAQEV